MTSKPLGVRLQDASRIAPTRAITDFNTIYKGTPIRFVEKFSPVAQTSKAGQGRVALFLDRDGVLNSTGGFINKRSDVPAKLLPKQIAAIREANQAGVPVVVVTNQGGIELNKMSPQTAVEIQKEFIDAIEASGGHLDAFYISPRKNPVPLAEGEVDARKPAPGLLMQASRDLKLDLSQSIGVGDQWSDILAFENAGLRTSVLVTDTGRNAVDRSDFPDTGVRPDCTVSDLATAVREIVVPGRRGSTSRRP